MNKYHLLILLCCVSNITIFGSEKTESFDQQLDRKIRQDTDNWNRTNYEKNEAIRKAKEQAYRENYNEIEKLKKEHQQEITLYEEKLTTMQLQIEQLTSKQANRKIAEESNRRSEQVQRQEVERNKRIIGNILKDNK